MGRIEGKVALITGAASGIGEATAELFAREGAQVMVADIQDELGRQVVQRIRDAGGTAEYIHCDVAAGEDVAGMVRATVDRFGRLDILYNNAGLGRGGSITEIAEEDWDLVIDVDLKSIYLGCKYAIPEMKKSGGGSIISTASIAGLRGSPALHAYSAAKAGVINLTRSIAGEAGPFGIRVNCICPGNIPSEMGAYAVDEDPERQRRIREAVAAVRMGYQPLKRQGSARDIGEAALWFASDRSAQVTAQILSVDAGATAGSPFSQIADIMAARKKAEEE